MAPSGRAAAERHTGQRSGKQAVPQVVGIEKDGEFAFGGDGEQGRATRAERLRFRIVRANGKYLW